VIPQIEVGVGSPTYSRWRGELAGGTATEAHSALSRRENRLYKAQMKRPTFRYLTSGCRSIKVPSRNSLAEGMRFLAWRGLRV
jgi:hypothetical protein